MNFNIKTDSRKIKKGDIFVALKTAEGDGHDYVQSAIEKGASKVVVSHGSYDVETIVVPDTRKYLTDYLIENYKPTIDKMHIIAFTGTNGKTTSTLLMYQALNKLGINCASVGTVGYFTNRGKEFYLANTSPDICDMYELLIDSYNNNHMYVTIEASSHGLALGRLEGIEYDFGIFSNLTRDHLDFHQTFENYALAKQELFKRIKKDGFAIVNTDDEYKDYFLLDNNNVTFGFNESDYQIEDFKMNSEGSYFKVNGIEYHTNLIGKYNALNMIPVIIMLQKMNIDNDKIKQIVSELQAPTGRLEQVKYKTNNIYIDYAHTPDGLEKAVSTVKSITKGKVYVVFCCRGKRDVGRRYGMMKAATDLADLAIVTSDNYYGESIDNILNDMTKDLDNTNYEVIIDRKEAIYKGIDLLKENDSLLILGHGHEETLTLENKQKIPFIEKDIVNDYISSKNCV